MSKAAVLSICALVALNGLATCKGDDHKAQLPVAAPKSAARLKHLFEHPDDVKALGAYIEEANTELLTQLFFYEDPDGAERLLEDFKLALAQIKPTTDEAKAQLRYATIADNARMIAVSRNTLEDLRRELAAKPDEVEAMLRWRQKVVSQIQAQIYRDPDEAKRLLESGSAFAGEILESTRRREVQQGLRLFLSGGQFDRPIAAGRKLLALVGQDAPPLGEQTWVNHPPLDLAELKGKVVVLDLFQLHRDRTASNPHVPQWHDRYAGNGLRVIGVARGSSAHEWDPMQKSLVPLVQGKTATVREQQESVRRLLDFQQVNYPVAICQRPHAVYDFYLSQGIVVIDRYGKVRRISTVGCERDALEIGKLIADLLGPE